MGGFNVTTGNKYMIDFCELNDLSRLKLIKIVKETIASVVNKKKYLKEIHSRK